MSKLSKPVFIFALKAVEPGTPEACRVRLLLKELGRKYKLMVSWPEDQADVRDDARLHAKQSDLQRNEGVSTPSSRAREGPEVLGNGMKNGRRSETQGDCG